MGWELKKQAMKQLKGAVASVKLDEEGVTPRRTTYHLRELTRSIRRCLVYLSFQRNFFDLERINEF